MIWPAVKKAFMKPVSLQITQGNIHFWVTAVAITNGTTVIVIERSTIAKFTTRMAAVVRKRFVRYTASRTKMLPKVANAITQPKEMTESSDPSVSDATASV